MKQPRSVSLAFVVATLAACASPPPQKPHQGHHAAGAACAPASMSMPGKDQMQSHMKVMHEMREKMMAAKTPAEREALAAEHMKIMRAAMDMMSGMHASSMGSMKADMAPHHQMMETRMSMMLTTLQMMMDHLPVPPAK